MIPTVADISEIDESILDEALLTAYAIKGDELKDINRPHAFYEFVLEFWDVVCQTKMINNWHIKELCDIVQENVRRVINGLPKLHDVVINISPGSSKSLIFSVLAPVWCWCVSPSLHIITGSHDIRLAHQFSVKSRDLIKSEEFEVYFPGLIVFKSDTDQKGMYENTLGGRRISCSVGSNITGFHADIDFIDDILNPEGARSEAELNKANRWLEETLASRVKSKKVTIIFLIMQRLAEYDPTGMWLEKAEKEGLKIFHVCLPGEINSLDNVKPRKFVEFYKNGLMDVNRLDHEDLAYFKVRFGRRAYASQILQNPSAIEGNVFLREYWKFYKELSQTRSVTYQSWDTAFKKGEENDYSCCTTWRVYPNGYYLVDFWMKKVETPELKKMIILKNSQFKPHQVLIEDKASGITSIQELRKESRINIVAITPDKDKISRANDAVPTIEAGNVYLPENASWTADVIDRLAAFPDGKNDDDVDSVTQFLNYIRLNQTGGVYRSRKPTPKLRGY